MNTLSSLRVVGLLLAGSSVTYLGLGIPVGVTGAMFADTVDFLEWKSGVRSPGLVYSASSISVKMGQGLGGALGAAVLASGRYVPNVAQTAESLSAIRFNYAWPSLISAVAMTVLLFFYNVDKAYPTVKADLEKRREVVSESVS